MFDFRGGGKLSEQIPLIEGCEPEPIEETPIPRQNLYLVAAYCRLNQGGYWKIHRSSGQDEYPTYESAAAFASTLSPHWVSRCVVRVSLG